MAGNKRRMNRHDKILHKKAKSATRAALPKGKLFLGKSAIGGLIHQAIQFRQIGKLHFIYPAVGFRRGIHQTGLIDQSLIHFHHLTGYRTFYLAGGFHRFNNGSFIANRDLAANFRQFHKNNIAQGILGKIGNAHCADRAFDANPLMIFSKFQHKTPHKKTDYVQNAPLF